LDLGLSCAGLVLGVDEVGCCARRHVVVTRSSVAIWRMKRCSRRRACGREKNGRGMSALLGKMQRLLSDGITRGSVACRDRSRDLRALTLPGSGSVCLAGGKGRRVSLDGQPRAAVPTLRLPQGLRVVQTA